MASRINAISQAMSPPRVTDAKNADKAIDNWEDKLVQLKVEYTEKLPSKVKLPP